MLPPAAEVTCQPQNEYMYYVAKYDLQRIIDRDLTAKEVKTIIRSAEQTNMLSFRWLRIDSVEGRMLYF